MTPEQFAYWLQGFVELSGAMPTPEQWKTVKDHLAQVFIKKTPPIPAPNMEPLQDAIRKWQKEAEERRQTIPLQPWFQPYIQPQRLDSVPWPTYPTIIC